MRRNIASGILMRRDDRGAQIAEEKDQHQKHQHHPESEVLEYGVQRGIDQRGAVVVGHDLIARAASCRKC